MTDLRKVSFDAVDLDGLAEVKGRIAALCPAEVKMSPGLRRLNRLTKGAVDRALQGEAWGKLKAGEVLSLAYPAGLEAEGVDLVKLERRPDVAEARAAGASLAKVAGDKAVTLLAEATAKAYELALGLLLRSYRYTAQKSEPAEAPAEAKVFCKDP